MATCGGSRDSPGRGLGFRIQYRRPTDGEDPDDGGVYVRAPLHCQWDKFMGAGMEGSPLPQLRHKSP